MTPDMCHFLPPLAGEKLSSCNATTHREKRVIASVISLGLGTVALGVSMSNTLQILSLQKEIALVNQALIQLSETTKISTAQLVTIQSDQIQLTAQLQTTQRLLDSLIPIINNQSDAINSLEHRLLLLQVQLQHSFLYQTLNQILNNDLTLAFLAPHDLHTVIYSIIRQGNFTFHSHFGSIPLAHIITRLLIRQQIDFIPVTLYSTSTPFEIGRLVITSFFAVPRSDSPVFLLYKLITTPFLHATETLQLSHVPRYFAIDPSNNTTIEWSESDDTNCDFTLMTTCRDTPPFRVLSNTSCLGQILHGLPLSKCFMITIPPSPFYLRQVHDNLWVTSSPQSLHCVQLKTTNLHTSSHPIAGLNEQLILPPVALVNVTPGSTLACPGFSITGRPIDSYSPSVIIFYNNTASISNSSVLDVHHHITNNYTWTTAELREHEIKNLKRLIEQLTTSSILSFTSPSSLNIILILGFLLITVLLASVIFIHRSHHLHPQNSLRDFRITLPTLPPITNSI